MHVYGLLAEEARGGLNGNLHRDLLKRSQDWPRGRERYRPTGAERRTAVTLGSESRLPPGVTFRQPTFGTLYCNATLRCGLRAARLQGRNRILIHLERESPRNGGVVMHLNVEHGRGMGFPNLNVLLPKIVVGIGIVRPNEECLQTIMPGNRRRLPD